MQITVHKSGAKGIIQMAEKVLSKYNLANEMGVVPLDIKGKGTISVLAHMKNEKYFDVCDVDRLAELHDVVIPREVRTFMSLMHCVHWDEMTSDTRDYLMAILVKMFEQPIIQSNL